MSNENVLDYGLDANVKESREKKKSKNGKREQRGKKKKKKKKEEKSPSSSGEGEKWDDFGCICGSSRGHRPHSADALSGSRRNHPRQRIVGGRDVKSRIKWIAYLQLRVDNDADFCTGSLINAAYVISAAHCACMKVWHA